jgi:hypothetical protein
MLPGITGTLVAASFLEQTVAPEISALRDWSRELRQLQRWWQGVERTLGPASSPRKLLDVGALRLFEDCGYRMLHVEPHGRGYAGIMVRDSGVRAALLVTPWSSDPDREWRDTVRAGLTAGARWGFIYSGSRLRIVDAARTWSRRVIDFDFARVTADARSATTFLALVHAAVLPAGIGTDLEGLVIRAERHGIDVCASLGDGVLEALGALLTEMARGRERRTPPEADAFEQAVTIVYRLLFLLFAEARAMLPTWHHVYREGYSIDGLCRRALAQPARRGLWKALQAVARMAHRGCQAGDLVVTPFNGRLFSPRHTPLAERGGVDDAIVARAVVALATSRGRGQRERIAYADLGVEQLGAVYERVLEYEPVRTDGRVELRRTSVDRKSTGSFYTPRSVTDFLVRRALYPLVKGKTADEMLALRILDPAMGSGAFLVAACRYLGDAVAHALADEGRPASDDSRDRASVRRLVAQRCLFGVDLNPMAVQLARLSLWLATLSSDRPLTFLDHHLAVGDSLIGASLVDLMRDPVPRKRTATVSPLLFDIDAAQHFSQAILPERFRIALQADDTPAVVHDKERALARLSAAGTPLSRWKETADLWCAAWFWGGAGLPPGVFRDVLAHATHGHAALNAGHRAAIAARARAIAAEHRFFHWELEFPEVFFSTDGQRGPDGGFDLVIGNPPWDVMRADTGSRPQRHRMREDHQAKRGFFRDSRVYHHQGSGHANRYQLFLERALQLTRPGGRVAMIMPSGLATDQGSGPLRRHLLTAHSMERIIGFDNRAAIFPIHHDMKFLLVTAAKDGASKHVACTFGHSNAQWLDRLPDDALEDPSEARSISLSVDLLRKWEPDHLTIPWLTGREDLDILARVGASVPLLSDESGWCVRFGRELNATEDRPFFVRPSVTPDTSVLKVVEGKHLEPFRVLHEACRFAIPRVQAAQLVDPSRTFLRSRIAYRDVASSTNRLTLIAARLVPGTVSTHTIFCSKDSLEGDAQYCLLALLNSLVANYLVRLRVTTHVTTAVMARLPVPRPPDGAPEFRELARRARDLEATGIARNERAYAEMNGIVAGLYGLSTAHYEHVVNTFPLLPASLRAACIAAYGRGAGPFA